MGRQRIIIGLLTVLLVASFLPMCAAEVVDTGTHTLSRGEFQYFVIDFSSGESITITYSVHVIEGPEIDVFVTQEAGFNDLNDPEAGSFGMFGGDISTTGVLDVNKSVTFDHRGKYYVIIDNTDWVTEPPLDENASTVTYEYWIDKTIDELEPHEVLFSFFGLILLITIVVVIGLVFRLRKHLASVKERQQNESASSSKPLQVQQQGSPPLTDTGRFCTDCGFKIAPGMKFCVECGRNV